MLRGILETFFLAATPIGELRAAIPVALAVYRLPWPLAFLTAFLGNLAPALFLLLCLEPFSNYLMKRSTGLKKFFTWLFERTRKKAAKQGLGRLDERYILSQAQHTLSQGIKKYKFLSLASFVAIPLPLTGVWTGCLIAFLFKMPFKKAFLSIAAGVAMAGAVVTSLSLAGIAIEQYFGLPTLLAILFLVVVIWAMRDLFKKHHF